MDFNYSRQNLNRPEHILERALEILPGALSWSILIGAVVTSIVWPLTAAVFTIAFILYWIFRLVYMNIFLVLSYALLFVDRSTDWMERIAVIDRREIGFKSPLLARPDGTLAEKISQSVYLRQLRDLKKSGALPPQSESLYHLVIIPAIKEGSDIVEPGIRSILAGRYPARRIFILLALEDRAAAPVKADMAALQKKYINGFADFWVVTHPGNLPGEAAVKGANTSYAARQARRYFDERRIPYANVIVSCFDADTVPNPDYFSCLTYHFMITPERTRRSYQPIPVYHNNIWNAPGFARIIDIGTSFFLLVESTNPSKLVTFSSHSMSFQALVDIGYWPVDMISDDSAIFWKAFIHYDGDYQTVPLNTTVSMDIVEGQDRWQTFVHIYKQKRRWAWGVENVPIVLRAFLRAEKISWRQKIAYGYKLVDSFVSWATWSFLLALLSWLPGVFAGKEFASTTVFYIAPRVSGTILSLSTIGIFICMAVSLLMLPPRRRENNFWANLRHGSEWLFIPAIVILLSAIPALDAQTRLMFGRYMEFWVTDKFRGKGKGESAKD
ncbi:MAG: glycosyltransferase [Candidatus Omnitrophica bacterium]|nr:glycosyltransferase [Candidatus Omnitrophota bacterium]